METQKDVVRRLLKERGEVGVGAHELTYQWGITRSAAIVYELRKEEQLDIVTKQEFGQQAVYVLRSGLLKPKPPEISGQAPLFDESELPSVTWEEVGRKLGRNK